MDFVMAETPEKMFFRHKQVHINFHCVFEKTLARGKKNEKYLTGVRGHYR